MAVIFLLLRRGLASVSTEKIAGSILSFVIAVVFASAFFMWRAEHDAPLCDVVGLRDDDNVGYGDYIPVTQVGRG